MPEALIVRARINGVQAGAASAPYVGNGTHVTPIQVISLHALQAGDVIQPGLCHRLHDP